MPLLIGGVVLVCRSRIQRPVLCRMSHYAHYMTESHGDYREETFLEQDDTPLYRYQQQLPRLPVPTLQETIDRFLPTAFSLAENEEEIVSLHNKCREFIEEAKPLQERLLQRQAEMKDSSWLQQWWNTLGYLQVRDPIVIYVSYFFQLADDSAALTGVQRGAAALRASTEFRQLVCLGDLPQDMIGAATPLCSVAYKYMFHACRVPKLHQDSYRIYTPNTTARAIVACRNQFFAIPVVDDNGNILPLSVLENFLRECEERAKHATNQLELGWLTTSNRDDWAHARRELLRIGGPKMECALELLESGMLVLCLDDEEPVSYRQRALEYWHGGMRSGGNRWFDKSIQLVISRNGKLGYVGEHSMMDGMPAVRLCEHLKSQSYEKQSASQSDTSSVSLTVGIVNLFEEACSNLTESDRSQLKALVRKAKKDFAKLVDDHQLHVESFQGYGSTWIKSMGFSPDAYVQMAIQLATYRLFGKQVGTYESTQVRKFLHGRTEATRSVSPESHAFVQTMGLQPGSDEHDQETRAKKFKLFRQATQSHVNYIQKAAQGQGVDRHLFGLSMLVQPGEESPSLYSHPLYARSKRWRVSTSTLPNMPGFGEVVADGVGIAYEIKPRCCMFTVANRSENGWSDQLCHLLEEALSEIRLLVDLETPIRSKL